MINYIDRMADALIDTLKYSDSSVAWPETEHVAPDPEIKPEWFYPALQNKDCSEIVAILLYTQQTALYDKEIGDMVLGIGIVEMKHFANIRDTVVALGGTLPQPIDGKNIKLGKDVNDALSINIRSEFDTIKYYRGVKELIKSKSETAITLQAMLDKLIADESLHLRMFLNELNERNGLHLIDDISETLYSEFPLLRISKENQRSIS